MEDEDYSVHPFKSEINVEDFDFDSILDNSNVNDLDFLFTQSVIAIDEKEVLHFDGILPVDLTQEETCVVDQASLSTGDGLPLYSPCSTETGGK